MIKLFEKQGNKKLGAYQQAAISLAQNFRDIEDLLKSYEVIRKFIGYARATGDSVQYADALWLQLPDGPVYEFLDGRFPPPAQTYEIIAHILEEFEKKRINTLIGERRTRIGAKLSEVTVEVKREIYAQSKLEHIYRQFINWTNDDERRRFYEEKLLRYCYDRLVTTSAGPTKVDEQKKVLGLAKDMVLIKHPFRLAWELALDWQDTSDIGSIDVQLLRDYCAFFPETDLYKVIVSYLSSRVSPFTTPSSTDKRVGKSSKSKLVTEKNASSDDDDDDEDGGVPTSIVPRTDDDRMIMMTDGMSTVVSILASRLAGEFFLGCGEYEITVEYMRKALAQLEIERSKTGLDFANTKDAYSVSLGTSLIYFQSPRHHHEAKGLFDKVLTRNSVSSPALIGVGLIYEEEEEYEQAIDFLERALKRDQGNIRVRSEAAWVQALIGNTSKAKNELHECIQLLQKEKPINKLLLANCQHRLGVCIWDLDTSRQARKQRKGESAYTYWLAALSNNLNHAPTYTSLGVYYGDYAKDKKRSRRCFKTALELSSSEVIAAERLARSFADESDWDRVGLVAQRVIESGKIKPPPGSKRKGLSWPFAALGVAELNQQEYHKAITSFQSALRMSPEDYHSWVGLGESYYNSGRYVAATKAIANARKLHEENNVDENEDAWFSNYMLANIKRELGDYDDSISIYKEVLASHPDEEGVVLSLLQTLVDSSLISIEKGLFGKSIQLSVEAVGLAAKATGNVLQAFNFWKCLGDACSVFTSVQSRLADFPAESVQALLEKGPVEAYNILSAVDKVGTDVIYARGIYANEEQVGIDMIRCLHATVLCYKMAIHLSQIDPSAQAVAYYNLGWSEYRAHICLPDELRKPSGNYIKASVRAFKRAIELEAGNAEFWNALGVVTLQMNHSVSQHAFARSLYINERSPVPWVNLGVLGLLSGDINFANDAFTRAQSTDPDYAHAWLGQAFIALMVGDAKEARALFAHAMEIADSSSAPVRRHYASAMFDHVLTSPSGLGVSTLLQSFYALEQVQSLHHDELNAGHLAALFAERVRDNVRAVSILEEICVAIEANFERTESANDLANFTLARTDLARVYLAVGSYEKAAECAEMALGLSGDEAESELNTEERQKARLSAHLTIGLSHYYTDNFEDAIGAFEAALAETDNKADVTCLLAQVLWAQGSEEARDRARAALFEIIETYPQHVQSVLLLGAIALLDNDEDSLEAVVEELHSLRTINAVTPSEHSRISMVLRAIAVLGEGSVIQDALVQAQNDVMLHPHLPHGWAAVGKTGKEGYSTRFALEVAVRSIPPRGILESEELSIAYAGTGMITDAQRAIYLAPWKRDGWTGFQNSTASL